MENPTSELLTIICQGKEYYIPCKSKTIDKYDEIYGAYALQRILQEMAEPTKTLAAVGKKWGFSKQRAHQLYKSFLSTHLPWKTPMERRQWRHLNRDLSYFDYPPETLFIIEECKRFNLKVEPVFHYGTRKRTGESCRGYHQPYQLFINGTKCIIRSSTKRYLFNKKGYTFWRIGFPPSSPEKYTLGDAAVMIAIVRNGEEFLPFIFPTQVVLKYSNLHAPKAFYVPEILTRTKYSRKNLKLEVLDYLRKWDILTNETKFPL